MKLFVDDCRISPCNWIQAHTTKDAIYLINRWHERTPDEHLFISLDHDAGLYAEFGGDFIKILDWIEEQEWPKDNITFMIHSANPVGRQNMERIIMKNGWNYKRW